MRRSKLKKYSVLTAVVAGTAGVAAMGAAPAAAAGTLKIAAGDDTYVSNVRPAVAFGAETKLVAGVAGKETKTSFLKFAVPAGTKVAGARLVLTTQASSASTVAIRQVANTTWAEGKLTAATAPALGSVLGSAVPGATLSFDLGKVVKGPGTYAFALSSTGAAVRFNSAEAKTGAPVLEVKTDTDVSPPVVSTPKPAGDCVTGANLVPSCGVLWGAAAGGFTTAPRDQALKDWEKLSGRTSTIFHTYHKGDEIFPTKAEIAMTSDAASPRVLLTNWKIAYGSTWAKVAQGQQDKRIDAFAARAKAYGKKFFLVLNHEPENDVVAKAGSGMEAKDFAAMYRHTILRLRAQGVTNVVNVMAYMGNEKWMAQSWWKDLYPGDDVVDWMGLDSYVSVEPGYYHYGKFNDLLDRAPTGGGTNWYDWATTKHAAKPIMVAEWGAYHRVGKINDKSAVYNSVLPELAKRPAIKAIVYFDTKKDDEGDRDISIDSTPAALAAFKKLAADATFKVKLG
ncbi:DNRLRE domain-containing protein [Actinoplanes sp. LDG1-06]|uniref:DNRLRE domain-containing protein n=1 Tax=Paractinoplanes ovalisporus TaxID=2810368 RepID=A0ABS2AUN5_9ACTN|nr:DNRLRE domain-containing protein [Actinoplanes ovalisporus]MBM2623063.1 DNRLRE domain-containing protein [Actinoplanes ovalisporus]